jgi:hypothetical protein
VNETDLRIAIDELLEQLAVNAAAHYGGDGLIRQCRALDALTTGAEDPEDLPRSLRHLVAGQLGGDLFQTRESILAAVKAAEAAPALSIGTRRRAAQ